MGGVDILLIDLYAYIANGYLARRIPCSFLIP
jgi:hypothetical protein